MVGGFNHNFKYKGHMYHVQTEDSGLPRARVTTLLYRGGSIIAREAADYRDIRNASDLGTRVEYMMKDQHSMMLKSLKDGAFDARIEQLDTGTVDQAARKQTEVISAMLGSGDEPTRKDEFVKQEKPACRSEKLDNMVRAYLNAGR